MNKTLLFVAAVAMAAFVHMSPALAGPAQELVQRGSASIGGDGRATYGRDGSYHYTNTKGKSWTGRYRILGADEICVYFSDGFSRCDEIRHVGDHLQLVTAWGDQYPIH